MKLFEEADKLIYSDREKNYGDPKVNIKHIARLWDAYIKNIMEVQSDILPKDVVNMMSLLKKARHAQSTTPVRDHKDSVVDDLGYTGLLGRLEEKKPFPADVVNPDPNDWTPFYQRTIVAYNSPEGVSQVETVNPSHPQTVDNE